MASKYIVGKLTTLLGSERMVEEYLRRYGEIVNEHYIEQIKSSFEEKKTKGIKAVAGQTGDDPVFEVLVQCPACNREDVVSYQLRSKSQTIKETLFLVPQYSGFGRYFPVDYNLLQTTVCPECLFASPDPKDWSSKSKFTGKVAESQLSDLTKLMAEIRNQELDRKSKFPAIKGDLSYFSRPRSYEKAIESIKLSMMRAELEARYHVLAVDYKFGAYYLKIADIEKKQNKEYKPTLKRAEEYFTASAIKSDVPSVSLEMMSIYQVVALNLYLGNKTKAAEFFKITKNSLRQRELALKEDSTMENRAALSDVKKWDTKITHLWEYRDDEDFWKHALD